MTKKEIIKRVRSLYPDAVVKVTGEECSIELHVVSDAFSGQDSVQRQKPILALFKEDICNGVLHALFIKAKTPSEQADQSDLVKIK